MLRIASVLELQTIISEQKLGGKTIGFVPTMGALHSGHISLVERSKRECDFTVVSIFINPTQFNSQSDFEKYPRLVDSDAELLEKHDCDLLFTPNVEGMYHQECLEVQPFDLGYLNTILEGTSRPGHYEGVATIVEKLFLAVLPTKVYMGLKDYQQVKIIEKLVRDRKLEIEIIGCATLRESNGLAMSSRNMRLTSEGIAIAAQLYKTLEEIKSNVGIRTPQDAIEYSKEKHLKKFPIKIEYIEIRNAFDLSEVNLNVWSDSVKYVVLIAAWVEEVRLIDNLELN